MRKPKAETFSSTAAPSYSSSTASPVADGYNYPVPANPLSSPAPPYNPSTSGIVIPPPPPPPPPAKTLIMNIIRLRLPRPGLSSPARDLRVQPRRGWTEAELQHTRVGVTQHPCIRSLQHSSAELWCDGWPVQSHTGLRLPPELYILTTYLQHLQTSYYTLSTIRKLWSACS